MKKTILVVDDEAELVELFSLRFQYAGYETIPAHSGKEAYMKAIETPVDCIVSDISMPNGSGVELVQDLRSHGNLTPVILITGFADITKDIALEIGASDLLNKPHDFDDMLRVVARAIEGSKTN
jgi:two-component system chemotaxis response regulator CheY